MFVVFCERDAEIFTLDFETCSSAKPNNSERKDEGDRLSARGKKGGGRQPTRGREGSGEQGRLSAKRKGR